MMESVRTGGKVRPRKELLLVSVVGQHIVHVYYSALSVLTRVNQYRNISVAHKYLWHANTSSAPLRCHTDLR